MPVTPSTARDQSFDTAVAAPPMIAALAVAVEEGLLGVHRVVAARVVWNSGVAAEPVLVRDQAAQEHAC